MELATAQDENRAVRRLSFPDTEAEKWRRRKSNPCLYVNMSALVGSDAFLDPYQISRPLRFFNEARNFRELRMSEQFVAGVVMPAKLFLIGHQVVNGTVAIAANLDSSSICSRVYCFLNHMLVWHVRGIR